MATNERNPIAAGFNLIYYGAVDPQGFLIGSTTTAPAAGNQTGSGMARLYGAKTAPVTVPDSEAVVATGDDSALAQFIFQAATLPAGIIETAVEDFNFEALAQGTTVYGLGNVTMSALQPDNPDFTDMVMLLQRQAKSYTVGTRGSKRNSGAIVRAQVTPLGTDSFTERQVATARYGFIVNPFDVQPWGQSGFTSLFNKERVTIIPFTSTFPMHMIRFTGNNTEDEFTLTYTPAAANDDAVSVFVNGVLQLYTSDFTVNVSTKTIAFVTPPANGAKIVVFYEYNEAS